MASSSARPRHVEQRRKLLELLERLHRHKDAAYGDAWRKRGEVIAIFANMARKYDRLLVAFAEDRPAATEALGDTVGDLCVHTAKYLTWIAEQHPDQFVAAAIGIDPAAVTPAQGPEPLAVVSTVLASEAESQPAVDSLAAWSEVRRLFDTLDAALIAQATPDSQLNEMLDFPEKTSLVWRLCVELSWLLTLLEAERPGALDAVRAEVDAMNARAAS